MLNEGVLPRVSVGWLIWCHITAVLRHQPGRNLSSAPSTKWGISSCTSNSRLSISLITLSSFQLRPLDSCWPPEPVEHFSIVEICLLSGSDDPLYEDSCGLRSWPCRLKCARGISGHLCLQMRTGFWSTIDVLWMTRADVHCEPPGRGFLDAAEAHRTIHADQWSASACMQLDLMKTAPLLTVLSWSPPLSHN